MKLAIFKGLILKRVWMSNRVPKWKGRTWLCIKAEASYQVSNIKINIFILRIYLSSRKIKIKKKDVKGAQLTQDPVLWLLNLCCFMAIIINNKETWSAAMGIDLHFRRTKENDSNSLRKKKKGHQGRKMRPSKEGLYLGVKPSSDFIRCWTS